MRQNSFYAKIINRLLDILLSAGALLFLWPVLLVTAILVRIKLGSPVIFRQARPGKDEKIFRLYKFRTMTDEKDANGNLLPDDIRLTKFGRLLRSTSLDELPELWNILKGDMSIVGPRPPLPREVAQYDEYQRQRLYITPGLTCYWQIQPRRNDLSFEEWMQLDIKYVRERSFLVDWKIILGTVKAVLWGEGE